LGILNGVPQEFLVKFVRDSQRGPVEILAELPQEFPEGSHGNSHRSSSGIPNRGVLQKFLELFFRNSRRSSSAILSEVLWESPAKLVRNSQVNSPGIVREVL